MLHNAVCSPSKEPDVNENFQFHQNFNPEFCNVKIITHICRKNRLRNVPRQPYSTVTFNFAFMITIDELRFSYGGRRVYDGLCTRFEKGTVYGLLGKNGAGKTTLLRLMAGLMECGGGKIEINGAGVSGQTVFRSGEHERPGHAGKRLCGRIRKVLLGLRRGGSAEVPGRIRGGSARETKQALFRAAQKGTHSLRPVPQCGSAASG